MTDKWKISDILDAMNKEKPKYDAARIRDDLRRDPVADADHIIRSRWNLTLPGLFGWGPVRDDEGVERVAAKLVSEAERLNVPRRG